MQIIDIQTIPVELPLVREHKMAYTHDARIGKFSLVKVVTDEGITGWGEAPTEMHWGGDFGTYYGESQQTTFHVIKDFFFPVLKGKDPSQIEALCKEMDRKVKGYPFAKAAIEIALFDIVGKAYQIPVYQLLSGLFRSKIPIQHSIGLMSPAEAAREAALVVEAGISTLKLKIGVDPARDLETVREVRKTVGPQVQIRVDGNRGYSTAYEAIKVIRQMEEYGLLLVEQPIEGLRPMAQVARKINVPLMADEGVWTAFDALRIYEARAADYLNVYITKAGGLIKAKKLVHTATVLGQICGVGGMVELGVGTAANLHFVASTPEINLACGLPVPFPGEQGSRRRIVCSYYKDHLEKNPPLFEDGYLQVPKGPGLGIELDEKKIEKYRL